MQRSASGFLLGILSAACSTLPAPPQPRTAMPVAATAGKTWDAVIDVFGERNIPIRNMERVSGFIATDALAAVRADTANADCGTVIGTAVVPTHATYNVIVRGDSSSSTVRVNIAWTFGDPRSDPHSRRDCSSKGRWETAFEGQVKLRAEAKK